MEISTSVAVMQCLLAIGYITSHNSNLCRDLHIIAHLHSGILRDTVKPDDGQDWARSMSVDID